MFKKFSVLCLALFLGACAGRQIRQVPPEVRELKKVDYFTGGRTQAAFKAVGQMNDAYLEGVLRIKKIGPEDYDVAVMTGAAYKVLQAVVGPEGVAYRYLFKDANTAVVRGRITQFLNLLVSDPGTYKSRRVKGGKTTVTYAGKDAQTRLIYRAGEVYPYAAQTVKTLNTGDLFYNEYAPADAEGEVEIPHGMTYKDGNITLDLTLISVR